MRFAWPCVIAGATLVVAACVGEDPSAGSSNDDAGATNDAAGGEDAGNNQPDAGHGGGGDGSTGPGDGVEGNVVDLGASPVENATVRIGSVTTTTDASGQFKISNITPPYDVEVVSPLDPTADGTTKFVMAVKGITTRTPIIHVKYTGAERRCTVTGDDSNLSWGGNNNRLKIQWLSTVGVPNGTTTPGSHAITPFTTDEQVTWQGKSATQGMWILVHWQEATAVPGTPTGFSGVQRIPQTLTDNVAATVPPWNLKPTQTVDLTGSTTFPAGATVRTVSFGMKLDNADRVGYTFDTNTYPPTANFTSKMPSANGITAQVVGTARMPNGAGVAAMKQAIVWKTNLAPNATGVTLAFPTAPTLTSPANASAMKVTDTIKWTGGTAPYRVDIDCKGYKAAIVTNATEAVLPAGLGSWPAAATACTATVSSFDHVKTIDETVAVDAPFKTTSFWSGDGANGERDQRVHVDALKCGAISEASDLAVWRSCTARP